MVSILKLKKRSTFSFENNSLDIWRYWAAISVMLLHYTGYALKYSEAGIEELGFVRKIVSFFPGVVILFAISGFLIAASIERSSNLGIYFKRRFIRIYPELWLGTIVNIGMISVLARDIMDSSVIFWGITQVFGISNTPSCLKDFATGSVNGALWTIFVEIQLYIVTGFTYRMLTKFKEYQWCILLGSLVVLNILSFFVTREQNGMLPKIVERCFLPYSLWFFIGVYIYMHKEVCIRRIRFVAFPLLIIYVVCYLFRGDIPGYYCDIATSILCPIIVVGLSYIIPPIRIKLDITYGIFLYHWLVLNVFTHFNLFSKISWLVGLVLFSTISCILAYLSHITIELVIKKKK